MKPHRTPLGCAWSAPIRFDVRTNEASARITRHHNPTKHRIIRVIDPMKPGQSSITGSGMLVRLDTRMNCSDTVPPGGFVMRRRCRGRTQFRVAPPFPRHLPIRTGDRSFDAA